MDTQLTSFADNFDPVLELTHEYSLQQALEFHQACSLKHFVWLDNAGIVFTDHVLELQSISSVLRDGTIAQYQSSTKPEKSNTIIHSLSGNLSPRDAVDCIGCMPEKQLLHNKKRQQWLPHCANCLF